MCMHVYHSAHVGVRVSSQPCLQQLEPLGYMDQTIEIDADSFSLFLSVCLSVLSCPVSLSLSIFSFLLVPHLGGGPPPKASGNPSKHWKEKSVCSGIQWERYPMGKSRASTGPGDFRQRRTQSGEAMGSRGVPDSGIPTPNRPQSETATSQEPLSSREILPFPFPKKCRRGSPGRKGGVPVRRGVWCPGSWCYSARRGPRSVGMLRAACPPRAGTAFSPTGEGKTWRTFSPQHALGSYCNSGDSCVRQRWPIALNSDELKAKGWPRRHQHGGAS